MTSLIRETFRRIVQTQGYRGVCDACGGEIEYLEPFLVIEIEDTDLAYYVVPIDLFKCPHCDVGVQLMRIWKSVDITDELKQLEKK